MADQSSEHTLELPDDSEAAPRGFDVGATVGHFRITREVGAGGMGIVFEAYDPDLDRRVAIKILRDRHGYRLIAEAQAMAKLAHPNVVAVHEVGTIGDQLFVVMELVEGGTLATWLAMPRSWREIITIFMQAGDGLVAAHEAGLVHRDFKPNNVLIDGTGRPRVADFGIAASDGEPRPHLAGGSQPAGTPGYMAPEQAAGEHEKIDGRADQYSFAVALREALPQRGVPRRVRRALDRALSTDPEARFPTMTELLAELRGAARNRRAAIAAIGLAGVSATIAAGIAFAFSGTPAGEECPGGASLVDEVWTPGARTRIASAGSATVRVVDEWVASWQLARRSACVAEPAQRRARVTCLDGRLAELRAQIAVWDRGDREILSRAYAAAAALPAPDSCVTADREGPSTATFVLVTEGIAKINALQRAGRSREATVLVPALLGAATATRDPAALASALMSAGMVERDLGSLAKAAERFALAAREATRAGDNKLVLEAMILQSSIAVDRGASVEAIGLLDAAAALVGNVPSDGILGAQYALARSDAFTTAGRLPEGTTEARRGVAILEPIAQRDPAVRVRLAAGLGALAAAESLSFRHAEARALLLRCLAIEEVDYGRDHPELAKTLHDLANTEKHLGQFDESRAHYARARAILVRAYGEHHQLVALSDYSLGGLELQLEHNDAARQLFERALAGLLATVDRNHPDIARIEGALGYILRDTDRCREALPHLERAREIGEHNGRVGTELAIHLTNLGACLSDLGRDAEARPTLERALAELVRSNVHESERAEANALLAEIEWRAGHRTQAIALAKEVIASLAGRDGPYAGLRDYMEKQLAQWNRR